MVEKGKINIIMPAYNSEKTIEKCIKSIQSQTYTNWELIIINDGSTDDTLLICDSLANYDDRIKVYTIKNSGVSVARNYALDKCDGEYITCIDSDDWIEPCMLEILLSYMDEQTEFVCGNFFLEKMGEITIGNVSKSKIYKNEISAFPLGVLIPESLPFFDNISVKEDVLGAACCKLYKRSLIENNHIRYAEGLALREDVLFNIKCFIAAKNMVITDKPLYHYIINNNSSNYRYRPDVHLQNQVFYNKYKEILPQINDKYKELFMNYISYNAYLSLIGRYIDHKYSNNSFVGKIKHLNSYLKNSIIYDIKITNNSFLPIYKRLELYCLLKKNSFFLVLLNFLRNIIKR